VRGRTQATVTEVRSALAPRAAACKPRPAIRRCLVDWSRENLAQASGVAHNTIKDFESGKSDPKQSTLLKWKRVLEVAGVRFSMRTITTVLAYGGRRAGRR
jgi:transcriptional regulator with XRE-family HTH domain